MFKWQVHIWLFLKSSVLNPLAGIYFPEKVPDSHPKIKLLTMPLNSVFSSLFTDSCQEGQFCLTTKSHAGRQPLRRDRHVAVLDSSSTLSGITKGLFAE